MAVRRRVTEKVTEDFDDLPTSLGESERGTLGGDTPSLGDIKANFKTTTDVEERPKKRELASAQAGEHERFTADIKAWFGHHAGKIFSWLGGLAIAAAVGIWTVAVKFTSLSAAVENLDKNVRDVSTQQQSMLERIIRVEARSESQRQQKPTPPKQAP